MSYESDLEKAANALKAGRGCTAGDVPCPFCLWGPDDMTPEFDETGCIWLARAVFAAIGYEPGKVIVPEEPTEAMAEEGATAFVTNHPFMLRASAKACFAAMIAHSPQNQKAAR